MRGVLFGAWAQGAYPLEPFRHLVRFIAFVGNLARAGSVFLLAFFTDAVNPGVEFSLNPFFFAANSIHCVDTADEVANSSFFFPGAFPHLS